MSGARPASRSAHIWRNCSTAWCWTCIRLRLAAAEAPGLDSVVALVAHGGYGRRDVAPYSDVDLMILHRPGSEPQVAPLVRHLRQTSATRDWSWASACARRAGLLHWQSATPPIFTSLVGISPAGRQRDRCSTRFERSFRRMTRRRIGPLMSLIEEARREERHQYGETVFLLEPNIKRSRGGLRDLQLLRWIGFARYGDREPESLVQAGVLSPAEDGEAAQGPRVPAAAAQRAALPRRDGQGRAEPRRAAAHRRASRLPGRRGSCCRSSSSCATTSDTPASAAHRCRTSLAEAKRRDAPCWR